MNFRPASLKMHNVHVRFHQLDATPLLGTGVRHHCVARCFFEVESFSLIRDDDGYFLAGPAAAPDVDFCLSMFAIAMHYCINQSLAERQFDTELFSRNTS
jgi:hypothetical protein